jgi:hypothetical protein
MTPVERALIESMSDSQPRREPGSSDLAAMSVYTKRSTPSAAAMVSKPAIGSGKDR